MRGLFRFILCVFAAFAFAALTARCIRRVLDERREELYLDREVY